ncbi:MAG: hypothetical protein AB1668_07285 [Nanoarchaeota archaeon]
MEISGILVSLIIVALVVGVVFIMEFAPEGSILGEAKQSLLNFINKFWPWGNAAGAGETAVTAEQSEAVSSLEKSIRRMLASREKNCFVRYGGFPPLGKTNIDLVYKPEEGKTEMFVRAGTGGLGIIKESFFAGMVPCVIAGEETITLNFERSFLNEKKAGEKEIVEPHFNNVMQIKIAENNGGFLGYTENRIDYGSGFKDFEDAGYLYTPDNKHICFFPTVDGLTGKDGLDDDYLGENPFGENSIPKQVGEGRLKSC